MIMSPADKAYMDMKYQPSSPFGQTWAGYINLETAYSWDPATAMNGIPEDQILGVEAPIWTEMIASFDDLEFMAFPRMLGYAEIGWTPQSERSWQEYKTRLAMQGPRLDFLNVNYYHSPEVAWP
jgi:hexosaminidase